MASEISTRIDWRLALLLFVAVLLLAMPQAARLPLLDRDEPRFAEASREMLQSGNYVVPTFNNAPRYAKPPLIYWCQAACYVVFGENAFAARLPSVVATAGTACLILVWCIRLGSVQIGFSAALAYVFCFQTLQQGRVATADALLIFFMTLIAFAGWLIIRPKVSGSPRIVCFVVLTLGIAGGFLAKGPEALLPFLPLLWFARSSGAKIICGLVASLLVGLALVLIWAIPAYTETNGDYWRQGLSEGVGQRMVSGLQGHGASNLGGYLLSLFYYPLFFLLSALPFWPLLVIHRKRLFVGWKPDSADSYLLLNAALIFIVFTLMVTKLPHYTLPAFPFLALFFARRWRAAGLSSDYLTRFGWRTGIIVALLAVVLIPVAMFNNATPSPVGQLVREARGVLTPDTEFAMVDFQEPNVIWEMRRVVKGYGKAIDENEVFSFLDQPGSRAVILPSDIWDRFHPLHVASQSEWKVYEASGFNAAKLRSLDLTLVVKP